ncbi:MAG: response regulator [Planctomycetota bacterium]|nr:MAG: response regulator [Planctomycetota bacterium]
MKNEHRRILIVDADSKAAQDLSSLLIDDDYDVETSEGISKAAERLKNVKFDCVIMDVNLPEMKGYEAVPILKAIDPKIQIVMTAAKNSAELEMKVRKQDIFYYYIKSFEREELKEAVRDVFKKLGRVKEVKEMNKPSTILVVDDDPNFVTAMGLVLRSKGYEVEAAYNSEEAMEKVKRVKPNLILLDIMMEKLTDGFDICYKLKHDPELKKIPVLAVSAIAEKTGFKFSPVTDGEYFEADDYVEKPVKPEILLKRIEKLLKG